MREKWQQECLLSLELPGRPGRPLLEQRAGASHSLFYFHIVILKQYEPSQHVALPFLYCYYYRYLHRIQVGNLQKCFNDSETKELSQKSQGFCSWGCTMFQTWPGFTAPVLSPKHISLFVVRHILQNPHFLLAQCNRFQTSALNPEK